MGFWGRWFSGKEEWLLGSLVSWLDRSEVMSGYVRYVLCVMCYVRDEESGLGLLSCF